LSLKLFSPGTFRHFNRWVANLWWGWCALWAEKINGTMVIMNGDDVPVRENALLLSNHQQMSDIPVIFAFAREKERLGDMKWYVKDIIKFVPGIGWGMTFLDCLYIKRNWTEDRGYIESVFEKILKYRIPVWIISFVEGTRLSLTKLARSQQYAEEHSLTPLQHVMIPRTKGFSATVHSLRSHLDAVYDVTIGYVDGVPTLWQWLKGYVHKVNLHVRRYPINELPEGREGLSDWLIERFNEKDDLLDYYYSHKAFPPVCDDKT